MKQDALAVRSAGPQELLTLALEKGASVEIMERLFALSREVRADEARDAWHAAMAEFHANVPPIAKTKTADIVSKRTGGKYSYSYAPLDEILGTIRPVLSRFGLSVTFGVSIEDRRVSAECRVGHALGHVERSSFSVPVDTEAAMNPAQQIGAASTYARRYALLAALGISPEDDSDASEIEKPPPKPGRTVTVEAQTQPQMPESGEVHVTVDRVMQRATNNGATLYTISAGGGEYKFGTFSRTDAELAKQHSGTGELLTLAYKRGRFGFELTAIEGPEPPSDAP